jgi:hypothetical protein
MFVVFIAIDPVDLQPLRDFFFFSYFWLTIQNTATSQAHSLFRVIAVCILFAPGAPLLLLGQLLIFAAAAARAPPQPAPPPPFGWREVPKKENRL